MPREEVWRARKVLPANPLFPELLLVQRLPRARDRMRRSSSNERGEIFGKTGNDALLIIGRELALQDFPRKFHADRGDCFFKIHHHAAAFVFKLLTAALEEAVDFPLR